MRESSSTAPMGKGVPKQGDETGNEKKKERLPMLASEGKSPLAATKRTSSNPFRDRKRKGG